MDSSRAEGSEQHGTKERRCEDSSRGERVRERRLRASRGAGCLTLVSCQQLGMPGRDCQADLLHLMPCTGAAQQKIAGTSAADERASRSGLISQECRRHDGLSGHAHVDGTGRHGATALGCAIGLELPVHHGSAGQDLQRTQLGSSGCK